MKPNNWEAEYMQLVNNTIADGEWQRSRAGRTKVLLGQKLDVQMPAGTFPLLTTRRMFPKPILGELAAFLMGSESNGDFMSMGCHYWTPNAKLFNPYDTLPEALNVGPIYGAQWRKFGGHSALTEPVDQLGDAVRSILDNPDSRRHVVTAWNPLETHLMCLPPCHILFQLHVLSGLIHMSVYMRSVDLCLGLPSDVVLYYALLMLMAHDTGYEIGGLHYSFGNAHVYEGHMETWELRQKNNAVLSPPQAVLETPAALKAINTFRPELIGFNNYHNSGAIKYALYA